MSNEKQEPKTWKEIESDFRKYRQSLDGVETISAYTYYLQNIAKLTPPSVEQPSEQEELWKELWELKEKCGHFHHDYIIKQFSKEFCIYRKGSEPSVDGELLEVLKEAEQVLSKHYASHPVLTKIDNLLASRSAPKESI